MLREVCPNRVCIQSWAYEGQVDRKLEREHMRRQAVGVLPTHPWLERTADRFHARGKVREVTCTLDWRVPSPVMRKTIERADSVPRCETAAGLARAFQVQRPRFARSSQPSEVALG
ncbi:hypothetical protein AAFF_G00260880 [Aldrovandia affinis]|uniref:Uncharacterized protein n=1 Tax=Aldrovandia affinis TaxID=143900 RepID=A0AAD7W231_9TELE|nr:hypothetical protein AAFF_G00260880 [Aldrovandia affinis]